MAASKGKSSSSLDFPSELAEKLTDLHKSIESVEEVLTPVFNTTVNEMRDKFQPLDRAKMDLVSAYALNALFWIYLKSKGENAQNHDVKVELGRIRGYMSRVKAIVDKKKAPKLNTGAAKRFLRSALYTQMDKKEPKQSENGKEETKTEGRQRKRTRKNKNEVKKQKIANN